MDEYIKRKDLLENISNVEFTDAAEARGANKILDRIKWTPAANVAPVVYGRWEPVLDDVWNLPTPVCVGCRCSVCGRDEQHKEPYCNCGARMDV